MAIEADYYFAAGDLVSWGRGLDKMGEIMQASGGAACTCCPAITNRRRTSRQFCSRFGFVNFHGGDA